jgi:4-amino-4-deoxy-L-arabinose transferase-like glycosyltransferase
VKTIEKVGGILKSSTVNEILFLNGDMCYTFREVSTVSYSTLKKTVEQHEQWVAFALLCIASLLRILYLTQLPYGLNQDEASAGYEAWALLNSGIDRNGNSWPVLLVSWGSGQNILYTLLTIPFVAIFGLNVFSIRLVSALCGIGTVVIFWRLIRRCRGPWFGLCGLFLIAVNPWQIMASRWALESNILPFFLLLGLYFMVLAQKNSRWLFGAATAFALGLYAYGTAFFFLPLFIVFYLLHFPSLFREKFFYLAALLFVVLALPITVCQLANAMGWEEYTILGITIPKLTETRQMATSVFGTGLKGVVENFTSFLSLLVTQSDGLSYNALSPGGLYYFFGLPLAIIGICRSLCQRKKFPMEVPLRLALYCGVICGALIQVNINRINLVWLPLLYFQVLGLEAILYICKRFSFVPVAGILFCFVFFFFSYSDAFGKPGNSNYFPGLGEAIEFAESQGEGEIYITDYVNQPYIFALFYSETSPEVFLETVNYVNPEGAFRAVSNFEGFVFGPLDQSVSADYYILHRSEITDFPVLGTFGEYVVYKAR